MENICYFDNSIANCVTKEETKSKLVSFIKIWGRFPGVTKAWNIPMYVSIFNFQFQSRNPAWGAAALLGRRENLKSTESVYYDN
jgi:hypothetical protein